MGSDDKKLYAIKDRRKLWEYQTGGAVSSRPAVGPDGTTYVGSDDGKVYGIKDGSLVWSFQTGGPIRSAPVIAADGTIYVTSHDKKLYALSREPVTERLSEMTQEKSDDKPAIVEDDKWIIIDGKKLPKKS